MKQRVRAAQVGRAARPLGAFVLRSRRSSVLALTPVVDEGSPFGSSGEGGDGSAADALFATLYAELHRLASRQLARSSSLATLGTTTLLHEA